MGSEKVVFLVIFIHPFENSGGYFFRGRLFWWILDINLQNFVRGYFSKFSLRGLLWSIAVNLPAGLKSDRWNVKKEENDHLVLLQIKFYHSEMVEQPSTQITEDEAKLYDRQIRCNILDGMKSIL